MTASATGTCRGTRQKGQAKGRLNRAVLDTVPGRFSISLCTKAQEAGCQVILLAPRGHRSSPTAVAAERFAKKRSRNETTIAGAGSQRREIKPQPCDAGRWSSSLGSATGLGREARWK